MKIVTSNVRPPIASRDFDWIARDENWEPGQPIGEGATEVLAIADLMAQIAANEVQESN